MLNKFGKSSTGKMLKKDFYRLQVKNDMLGREFYDKFMEYIYLSFLCFALL